MERIRLINYYTECILRRPIELKMTAAIIATLVALNSPDCSTKSFKPAINYQIENPIQVACSQKAEDSFSFCTTVTESTVIESKQEIR